MSTLRQQPSCRHIPQLLHTGVQGYMYNTISLIPWDAEVLPTSKPTNQQNKHLQRLKRGQLPAPRLRSRPCGAAHPRAPRSPPPPRARRTATGPRRAARPPARRHTGPRAGAAHAPGVFEDSGLLFRLLLGRHSGICGEEHGAYLAPDTCMVIISLHGRAEHQHVQQAVSRP